MKRAWNDIFPIAIFLLFIILSFISTIFYSLPLNVTIYFPKGMFINHSCYFSELNCCDGEKLSFYTHSWKSFMRYYPNWVYTICCYTVSSHQYFYVDVEDYHCWYTYVMVSLSGLKKKNATMVPYFSAHSKGKIVSSTREFVGCNNNSVLCTSCFL